MNTGFNAQHMWNWCKTKGSILSFVCVCQLTVTHYCCYDICSWCKDMKTPYYFCTVFLHWGLVLLHHEQVEWFLNFDFGGYLASFISYSRSFLFIFNDFTDTEHTQIPPLALIQASCFPLNVSISPPNYVVILTDLKHDMRRCPNTFSWNDACCHSCSCEWSPQSSCQSVYIVLCLLF